MIPTTIQTRPITYWVYFHDQCVGTHRGLPGLSEQQVKTKLLLGNEHLLCDRPNESPADRARKIAHGRVHVYSDGR